MELRKGTAEKIVLRADRALFAQMIVIAEARQLGMKYVLSQPLGPLPWSPAASDKELQKDAPAFDNPPPQSSCIIDGMAMVQRTI